jgi:hypothetical protein
MIIEYTFTKKMDDFVLSNLNESRNEWSSRLVGILTPLVIQGIRSIFNEAWNLSIDNNEVNKYLMTFQNLLSCIPKWNNVTIEKERKRIIEKSGCNYLEDLITCVHIIQLKVLTSIRVSNRQKKIDISTPKLDTFIHKVYINVARKVYSNVYLFENNISPLLIQKNNRELELIVQECILVTIRDSIPTESIIRAYLDESVEQEEEVVIENIENPVLEESSESNEISQDKVSDSFEGGHDINSESKESKIPNNPEDDVPTVVPSITNIDNAPVITRLSFNDTDTIIENKDNEKDINYLEKTSLSKLGIDDSEDFNRIKIHTEDIDLTGFDILDDRENKDDEPITLDFEEL